MAAFGLWPVSGGAQTALVIGNSAYAAMPKLPACDISANLAAAALTRAGFRVRRELNPSNARMGTAIANFGDEIAATPSARVVIYVCGYVAAYAERLFLLPVEAKLERDTDVLSQGIIARLLMSSATASPSGGAALVLLDATSSQGSEMGALASVVRPADLARAGFAAAQMAPPGDQSAAPLASALSEMLRPGNVELGAALAGLPGSPGLGRARLLAVRPPNAPAWLVGQAGASAPPRPVPPAATPGPAAPTIAPPAAPTAAPGAAAWADLNPAERRRVQVALQRLGYFKGVVNGRFGLDTEAAIRQLQRESGDDQTGRLTADEAKQLLEH